MITKLHFKNWRSLRDVEINDLTPITVFIGANSSGKSNIFEAVHFLRYAAEYGVEAATFNWLGVEKLRHVDVDPTEDISLELAVKMFGKSERRLNASFQDKNQLFGVVADPLFVDELETERKFSSEEQVLRQFILQRWQLLDENTPSVSRVDEPTILTRLDRKGRNLPSILDYMHQKNPELFDQLESDAAWLLEHVQGIDTERTDGRIRFLVRETLGVAPTISIGTARVIEILTAFALLNWRDGELPGFVAIEEPDLALHPLLLSNLVELFRNYVEGDNPRQLFLTTHNPTFVNLFKPEEVRIVERDENGDTHVRKVDAEIAANWEEEGLGDVWMTRLLGGVPSV
jgi:predicted ATPase